jgi:hypothetical protein
VSAYADCEESLTNLLVRAVALLASLVVVEALVDRRLVRGRLLRTPFDDGVGGVDKFSGAFPHHLTQLGKLLTFPVCAFSYNGVEHWRYNLIPHGCRKLPESVVGKLSLHGVKRLYGVFDNLVFVHLPPDAAKRALLQSFNQNKSPGRGFVLAPRGGRGAAKPIIIVST